MNLPATMLANRLRISLVVLTVLVGLTIIIVVHDFSLGLFPPKPDGGALTKNQVTEGPMIPSLSYLDSSLRHFPKLKEADTPVKNPVLEDEPMVLSLSYWEQTGNALKNLIDLQCWAHSINISKVVEPSIVPNAYSSFMLVFGKNYLKFGDLFDIAHWNSMSREYNYSILASLEYFLAHSVKALVFVSIRYAEQASLSCEEMQGARSWQPILENLGFSVVKKVCIDFSDAPSHTMSESKFRDLVFHGVGNDVSVVFNQWRGIRSSGRVALNGTQCSNCLGSMAYTELSGNESMAIAYTPFHSLSPIRPSQKIRKLLDVFRMQYLSGDKYIAVMLRSEKMNRIQFLEDSPCASAVISDWSTMVEGKNITKTLFFSDIGAHGSKGWHNFNASAFSKHIQDALNLHLTFDRMNLILEGMTGSGNSVEIAFLQQQLVARATCVVMVGGGSFQMQALHTYAHLHRGHECYAFRHRECERKYISQVYGQRIHQPRA